MRVVNLSREAEKFLRRVPAKHQAQLAGKLLALSDNPRPNDSKQLAGSGYRRVTVGEYRIVYGIEAESIDVVLLDKRDKVYKRLRHL